VVIYKKGDDLRQDQFVLQVRFGKWHGRQHSVQQVVCDCHVSSTGDELDQHILVTFLHAAMPKRPSAGEWSWLFSSLLSSADTANLPAACAGQRLTTQVWHASLLSAHVSMRACLIYIQ
jgi:hypothetical protein